LPNRPGSVSTSKDGVIAVAYGYPSTYQGGKMTGDGGPRGIRLYTLPDLKEVGQIECADYIYSVAVSPDGRTLATTSQPNGTDKPLRKLTTTIWDARTGKARFKLGDPAEYVAVGFSPDGKKVIRTSPSREYDVETGNLVTAIPIQPSGGRHAVQYLPDGSKALFQYREQVVAWNFKLEKFEPLYSGQGESTTFGGSISADNAWLVFGVNSTVKNCETGTGIPPPSVVIFDLKDHRARRFSIEGIGRTITSATLSPDRKTIAVGALGGLFLMLLPE
jgi:WD40 repeat protein